MAIIDADIKRIYDSGKNIKTEVDNFRQALDSLYKRLENMSNTKEWVGVSANEFIRMTRIDRKQYEKLGDILNHYGDNLIYTANKLSVAVNYYDER